MKLPRRAVLQTGAAGALFFLPGCERLISATTQQLSPAIPTRVLAPTSEALSAAHHLLARAAFGARPGEVEKVAQQGLAAWVDAQLQPQAIDDAACRLRARRFETIEAEPGMAFEYKPRVLREELARHTLLRATYSERQLFEVMVGFWNDHFNVDIEKGDCLFLKATDDREVIRRHALGRFEDLVRGSVTSAAMLVYLDGTANSGKKGAVANENHARELLELHTLGVHGGYTQRDVSEAARCLTGWRVKKGWGRGTVFFDAMEHDDGPKRVLGVDLPAGLGARDVDSLVAIVCRHPSTAQHLVAKLARRFVSENPPASLVQDLAQVFSRSNGDLALTLRALFSSQAFAQSRGALVKTPLRYLVSALRAVGADTHAHAPLLEYLTRMGQGVFQFPTPDGYPQSAEAQAGTLLWRWTLAVAIGTQALPTVSSPLQALDAALLAGGSGPTVLSRWGALLFGQALDPELLARLDAADRRLGGVLLGERVALLLCAPHFMRC